MDPDAGSADVQPPPSLPQPTGPLSHIVFETSSENSEVSAAQETVTADDNKEDDADGEDGDGDDDQDDDYDDDGDKDMNISTRATAARVRQLSEDFRSSEERHTQQSQPGVQAAEVCELSADQR